MSEPVKTDQPNVGATDVTNAKPAGEQNVTSDQDKFVEKISPLLSKALGYEAILAKKKDDQAKAEPATKPADKPADKPVTDPDKDASKPANKPVDKPADKSDDKPTEPAKRKRVTVAQVVEDAVEKAADRMASQFAGQDKPADKPDPNPNPDKDKDTPEVPEEYVDEVRVLEHLEKTSPEKFRGKVAELKKFISAEEKYVKRWEDENPGKTFNCDDHEHDDFYNRNQVSYDHAAFKRAEVAMIAEEIASKKVAENSKELDVIKREREIEKLMPAIQQQNITLVQDVVSTFDETYRDKAATRAGFDQIADSDPIVADAVMASAVNMFPVVATVVELFDSNGAIKVDVKNERHMEVMGIADQLEQNIVRQPLSSRIAADGRKFATWADYAKMDKAEQDRHWVIGRDEILFAVTQAAADKAKTIADTEIKKQKRYASKLGIQLPTNQDNKSDKSTERTEAQAPAPSSSKSPSAVGGDKVDTSLKPGPDRKPSVKEGLANYMFGPQGNKR